MDDSLIDQSAVKSIIEGFCGQRHGAYRGVLIQICKSVTLGDYIDNDEHGAYYAITSGRFTGEDKRKLKLIVGYIDPPRGKIRVLFIHEEYV